MIVIFALVAGVYASVGFGGGSSYIAILAMYGFPFEAIPLLALSYNLIVVSGGVWQFYKKGHLQWSVCWPYLIGSMPMAYFGGRLSLERETFYSLLSFCLLLVGLRLIFFDRMPSESKWEFAPKRMVQILLGSCLGFVSGLVGIGGGIFLSPILLLLGWARPKQVAGLAALFIFLNSISGILGQLAKSGPPTELWGQWPLLVAVLLGGQVGSRMGAGQFLSGRRIKDITAVLVLVVSCRLLFI